MTRHLTSYPEGIKGVNLIEKHKNYLIEYGDKSGVNGIEYSFGNGWQQKRTAQDYHTGS